MADLKAALQTARDYVFDAASGTLTYPDSGESFIAMAKEDLVSIDAALASSPTAADLDKDAEIARMSEPMPEGWTDEDEAAFLDEQEAAARHGARPPVRSLASPPNAPKPMTKKPWGEDYIPDDRPWTFPPNALLPTEEVTDAMIEAGKRAAIAWERRTGEPKEQSYYGAIYAAMRALAKPDEGVVK